MRLSSRGALALAVSAAALLAATALPAAAQQRPQGQQQAPAPAPIKPYTPVAITLAIPVADPSFEAFRKQLGEAARKKDKAALAKLVVAQGFFWEAESGDKADKKKSGIDNLSTAIGLGGEGFGWDTLNGASEDPTLEPLSGKQGVSCGPASPKFDNKAFDELMKATGTDGGDWGYPLSAGVDVRGGPAANAPVTEKLGMHLVRVLPDEPPAGAKPAQPPTTPSLKIVLPSGKVGHVPIESISPIGMEQICYVKDGASWKITGFIGGDQ
jgi:hypothetical protein